MLLASEEALLPREPRPCSPAAETALRTPIFCPESPSSKVPRRELQAQLPQGSTLAAESENHPKSPPRRGAPRSNKYDEMII